MFRHMKTMTTSAAEMQVSNLAEAMLRDYPNVRPSADNAWKRSDAARVIDCVLSLNRNYDRFVVPRVKMFEKKHPSVTRVSTLRDLILSCSSPHEFVQQHLSYNHATRANTLMAVVNYLTTVGDLREWARTVAPSDYKNVGIHGFGIAGWQYLRMLFDADTVKPDIRIRQYVEKVLGVQVSDPSKLLLLFEAAAKKTGMSCKDLDNAIWEELART